MTRSGSALVLALAAAITACDSTGPTVTAHGKARFLNGATPRAPGTGATLAFAGAPPANGQWLLSPDRITFRLKKIMLSKVGSTNGGVMQDVDCTITYDKSQPGLTQLAECPFVLDTGTYDQLSLTFAGSYDLYINDAARGFYTTTAGIVTSAPAGGAQPWSFTPPQSTNGEFSASPFALPTPLVVSDSSPITMNVVINGLQFFWASVNGSAVTTTGTTYPQRPDFIASVGSLAGVEFYSRSDIGTAESYCAFQCATGGVSQGVMSTSVYYSGPTTPSMVNLSYNGSPGNCTIGGPTIGFLNSPKSYIGLDASANLGWAVPTDQTYGTYRAEMRLARLSTVGSSTQLYCKSITVNPSPAGGSYASGAPAINQAANSIGTYILVAK